MTPDAVPQVVVSDGRSAHAEVMLDAPQTEAFSYVTDLQNMVVWWPEHTAYRRIFGDGGPGSLYVWVYATTMGVSLAGGSMVLERVASQRINGGFGSGQAGPSPPCPQRFVYFVRSPGLLVRFEYGFFAEGEPRTRMTFAMRSYLLPPPIPTEQLNQAFDRLGRVLAARTG